jgi:hypothetical protein
MGTNTGINNTKGILDAAAKKLQIISIMQREYLYSRQEKLKLN